MFEIIKPCQNCKSFILRPKKNIKLNLEKITKKVEKFSFEILAFTGSMLSLKKDCRINIYNSGKKAIITKRKSAILSPLKSPKALTAAPKDSSGLPTKPNHSSGAAAYALLSITP